MDIVMPQLGETVSEGTVTVWHKKPGDRVEANELLFEVSTDKVDTEIPAPAGGTLIEVLVEEGVTVPVGARLGVIRADGESAASLSAPGGGEGRGEVGDSRAFDQSSRSSESPSHLPHRLRDGFPPLSPVVSRLLAEHGLSPADIKGTGAGGRIKRKDVEAHLDRLRAGSAPPVLAETTASDRTIIPFDTVRKRTATHMVRSKATSPHVLQAVEVDFAAVDRVRAASASDWKAREGFSLTFLPFIAKAVCEAIAGFPNVNASIEGEALVVWHHVHLGIAVDLDFAGLVAPVIRNAQDLSVTDLARAIADRASSARARTLSPDDYAGGTYTISNSGSFGTLITAPIINQPQVAILSTDGVRKRPVVVEGDTGDDIVVRPVGVLAQSFDHRAIDGAYSAAFLRRVREIIEGRDWRDMLE